MRHSSVRAAGAGVLGWMLGCSSSDAARSHWTEVTDSNEVRILLESPSICRDCIVLERVAVLGDTAGPGYVEWTKWLTQDSSGNYWVGQRGAVKVFDSAGNFLRQIGRAGEGPMEFNRPQPIHTDAAGRIHILDSGNLRETVVGPDLTPHGGRRLPGFFNDAAVVADGARYALNMLQWTRDRAALPLHIAEGSEVLHSFGELDKESAGPAFDAEFSARRLLAADRSGHIFSARYYNYLVEVWSATGRRITGFGGAPLNRSRPRPAAISDENPPANQISAIDVDGAQRLWLISWRVRDDWRDRMVEFVLPDGQVGLRPLDDSPASLHRTRIEVIDLNSASIVASRDREELLEAFIGDRLGLETQYLEDGTPQLVMWRMALLEPAER